MNVNIISHEARADWERRGRNLADIPICWNSLKAIAGVEAGLVAGSKVL
jgi:hypothetical protein